MWQGNVNHVSHVTIMWQPCNCQPCNPALTYIPILYTALQHQRFVLGIVQQLPHILRSAFSSCLSYHHLEARVPLSRDTQKATTSYPLQEYSTVSVYTTSHHCQHSNSSHVITLQNLVLYECCLVQNVAPETVHQHSSFFTSDTTVVTSNWECPWLKKAAPI